MTRPSFDLTTEPWIPALGLDGQPYVLSLREIFCRAHELRWLDAEAPPMTGALHRLLLAVLHASLDGPRTPEDWGALWEAMELPSRPVHDYLDRHAGGFDLFDRQRPFLQCPALASVRARPAAQLVHFRSVGNNGTLFDHTTAAEPLRLSFAEAARWLVTVQCYDPGGTKTPYKKVKNSSAGLGNRFGMVLVEGNTLKETLLLNAHRFDRDYGRPWSSAYEDRPAWESEPPQPEPDTREPYGWLDLLTWPARRVLLHPTADAREPEVDGVVITPGTTIKKTGLHGAELMAAFERPHAKSKNKNSSQWNWNPVRLGELRGIWRHARTLLLAEDEQQHQRPMVLDHVADQVERGTLSRHAVFTIRVFGQQLDDNGGGSVYTWLQEQLPAPAALLTARHPWLGGILGSCVALADGIGDALTSLAKDCRKAFHAEHSAEVKRSAKHNFGLVQDYWPKLPSAFATLLLSLGLAVDDESSPKPPVFEWKQTVRAHATAAADQLINQLRERQARHLYEIAGAYANFEREIARCCRTFDRQIAAYLP
ncbi:type I-E CRISPR-associated protein Cse1/CasA [Saccharopolyspora subtropica]|uniref:Type I-E CRISPR-associated protein Cse1/CasA n=1 Tax=Saccharopolyspora thermophila TaxID=89367 RepID=A0A917K577_9PSEU|nr:type I-E CRISPR-associated protein Cse1/CasA [Saccharopolyspora subtropica]GGI97886.1 type I-E CRISPR-associated protein Cse1/CasA [Saccharopolyspora subtropica]